MRYIQPAILITLSVLNSTLLFGQVTNPPSMSVGNYKYVGETRVSRTQSNITYQADLINTGPAFASATATLTSLNVASFTVVAGSNTLSFSSVPASGSVTSSTTFTILVDRTVTFDNTFSSLKWTIQAIPLAPVANAGANASSTVGKTVTLNGSGSTNPSNVGTL